MPSASGAGELRRIFANRNFTLLFLGQVISSFGDELYDLALLWYVFGTTGSALQAGGVLIMPMLAQILLGLPLGALVDRWNRKVTMIGADLLRAVIVLGVAGAAMAGQLSLPVVYGAGFLLHAVTLAFGPARSAVIPDVVGDNLLLTANAAQTVAFQSIAAIGLFAGGVLVAVTGATWAMLLNGCSFVVSALCIGGVRLPAAAPVAPLPQLSLRTLLADIGAGLRYARQQPVLLLILGAALVVNFGDGLYTALTPALTSQVYHADAAAFGLVCAGAVLGAIAGGLVVRHFAGRFSLLAAMIAGEAGAGGAAVLLGLNHTVVLGVLLFFALGLAAVVGNTPLITTLQVQTPSHMRGRIFGLFGVLCTFTRPPAVLLGTWCADRFGPLPLYVVGGAIVLLGPLVLFWGRRRFSS